MTRLNGFSVSTLILLYSRRGVISLSNEVGGVNEEFIFLACKGMADSCRRKGKQGDRGLECRLSYWFSSRVWGGGLYFGVISRGV